MKKGFGGLVLAVMLLVLAACSEAEETPLVPLPPTNEIQTIMHDEREREYQLYIPEGSFEGAPLLIMMHGYTSSHLNLKQQSQMDAVAQEHGFVVAYLLGTETIGGPHWNADLTLSTVDDIGFVRTVIDHLTSTYNLSEENVFGSGFSNGAFMTYTIACQAPNLFKAIAPVAGLMSGATYESCENPEPMNILHIHGTGDLVVPIDGTMTLLGGFGGGPDVEGHFEFWKSAINGNPAQTSTPMDGITVVESRSDTGMRVKHMYIDDFPHVWPLSPNPNELGMDPGIHASEEIWAFFSSFIS